MPRPELDFYYWVLPRLATQWEVMQKGRRDYWYRMGTGRAIRDREIDRVGPMVPSPSVIRFRDKEEKQRMLEFIATATEAGFTEEQANFMWEHMALKPHTHTPDEIIGLEEDITETVQELCGEDDEDEDDDEDE